MTTHLIHFKVLKTLLYYSICCCLYVYYFGLNHVSLLSCLIPDFYAHIPSLYAEILCYLVFYVEYRARCASGGGGDGGGGGAGLLCVFNQTGSLTCHPDSQFRIPVWIPFPQGTGEMSSLDHLWIGPCNRDFDSTVYPLPGLAKGVLSFSLPRFDSILRMRAGLTSLELFPLREQMEKRFTLIVTVLTVLVLFDFLPPG